MRPLILTILLLLSLAVASQPDMVRPFKDCAVQGSCTIYDYKAKKWLYSDSDDAFKATLPASTFKVINTLIALETEVVKDETEVVKWTGKTDTTNYGYRPEIYRDLTVKEAFEASAVWVYLDLAEKIGRAQYHTYLNKSQYGNGDLSEKGEDFWNFGPLAISPVNQIEILIKLYEDKLPFSKRNMQIVRQIMITEQNDLYTIRSKTGWSRLGGKDTGWWIGYLEGKDNVWFFATRISKDRSTYNPNFSSCRKEITKNILKQLKAFD